jgi:hypothetical protein
VANTEDKSRIWHERLGHLNYRCMQLIDQPNMVHGLPRVTPHEGVCKGCILGKYQRVRFEKGIGRKAMW